MLMSTREVDVELEVGEDAVVTYQILAYPTCSTGPSFDSAGEPGDAGDWRVVSITATVNDETQSFELDNLSREDRERIDVAITEDIPTVDQDEPDYDEEDYWDARAEIRDYAESKMRL